MKINLGDAARARAADYLGVVQGDLGLINEMFEVIDSLCAMIHNGEISQSTGPLLLEKVCQFYGTFKADIGGTENA